VHGNMGVEIGFCLNNNRLRLLMIVIVHGLETGDSGTIVLTVHLFVWE
jgi:hypothetical protein